MKLEEKHLGLGFLTPKTENSEEYEYEKFKNKQKLVRNEFEKCGYFGMPMVKKQHIDLRKIQPLSFTNAKLNDGKNAHKTICFYTYDWKFDSVYDNPEKAFEKLEQYEYLITPEFSTYKNMPLVLQAYSVFKNRWCGAFWQSMGKKVIPTITWGTPDSHDFCFTGVEQGAVVAVSTYKREHNKQGFMQGYNKMLEIIKPSAVVCYGDPFPEMQGNVVAIDPFDSDELIAKIGAEEYLRRKIAGELYPE